MWCYQKPGFEALLLAELQKQQQCNQFCDTLLKAEGVSVPAHSCVLSAISPIISSALTSTSPPPPGQRRLLEFQAVGACTLLHMVRLLYSGEMAGEGEKEKQEAVLAAAKLGIHGLVEVTQREFKGRNKEGGGQHTDVAVQTESLTSDENDARRSRWRRDVSNGSTILWKETVSHDEMSTHTEELQVNTCPPVYPATLETIDTTALQSLGQTDTHLVPTQIPYVPISLVYPLNENGTQNPSSVASVQGTAAVHTSVAPSYSSSLLSMLPFSTQATSCGAHPQSWWTDPQADVEEWEDEQVQQFQGNIPGFISHFLNPEKGEVPSRRRRGRPRGSGRARTSERRVRTPRVRTRGSGRGGLTQTVDVQNVGVSRLQTLFLQRGGVRASRPGQGGGTVGRKLHLKTRQLLTPAKSCQSGRRRGKVWEFSQSGHILPVSDGGCDQQSGEKNTVQQYNQDISLIGRPRRARGKKTSFSLTSPSVRFNNVHILPASNTTVQPSSSTGWYSPAASLVSPTSSLHHTNSLPPLAPLPHEDQPEHIDRLLEEVMMGLDILANNSSSPDSQPPFPSCSSSCTNATSVNNLTPNKQQGQTAGLQDDSTDFHVSTQIATVTNGRSGLTSVSSEMPILQLPAEGELNEILDNFLHSFEQHVERCSAREEMDRDRYRKTQTINPNTSHVQNTGRPQRVRCSKTAVPLQSEETQPSSSQQHKETPSPRAVSPKHTGETSENAPSRRQKRRPKSQYMSSLERKRKSLPLSKPVPRITACYGDKQLRQIPVVKLQRTGLLPGRFTVQSQEVKSPTKTQTSSTSVKQPCDRMPSKNQPKMYPIRSRLRKPRVSSQDETEGPAGRGEKRGAESEEEILDAAVVKRVCSEQMEQPNPETRILSSESADCLSEAAAVELEDVIDVETISLTSVGGCLQRKEKEMASSETRETLVDEEVESSSDEIIDVDGDSDGIIDPEGDIDRLNKSKKEIFQSRTAPALLHFVSPRLHSNKEVSLGSTGSWEDEDIDVIGSSSPLPDPVIISWTESSEGEQEHEDVDVVGEKTDSTSFHSLHS